MKVCFFAGIGDRSLLDLMQWYHNDIRALKELGFDVVAATRWSEIPWDADLYFAWWPSKGVLPLIKGKLKNKPVVLVAGGSEVVHSYKLRYNFVTSSFLKKAAVLFTLRHADRVLAISKAAEREIRALVPTCRVSTVYLSVDTSLYRPADRCQRDIIYTITHLNKENIYRKRILSVVQAAPYVLKEFPSVTFVIAGRKMEGYDLVASEIRRLGVEENFALPGKVSNEDKIGYFQRSLVYVQPTLHEGFGLAIAEAMSCAVPVVTSKVGAVPEVVGETGIYVDPNDPEEIGESIVRLLKCREMRESLGQAGRERIETMFSYEARKRRIAEVLKTVV